MFQYFAMRTRRWVMGPSPSCDAFESSLSSDSVFASRAHDGLVNQNKAENAISLKSASLVSPPAGRSGSGRGKIDEAMFDC